MKRTLIVLMTLFLGLALAQKVPVTAFHLVPGVLWPAPAYRVLGAECEKAVAALKLPEGTRLEAAQCYELVIANPDDAATYLYFIARGLSQRMKLLTETMSADGALVQIWQGADKKKLYLHVKFGKNRFFLIAGWLTKASSEAKP